MSLVLHKKAFRELTLVALCRVCPAGTHMNEVSIGRVITTERGKGYGKRIMLEGIEVGFRQSSAPFILDGIPHIKMTLLTSNKP